MRPEHVVRQNVQQDCADVTAGPSCLKPEKFHVASGVRLLSLRLSFQGASGGMSQAAKKTIGHRGIDPKGETTYKKVISRTGSVRTGSCSGLIPACSLCFFIPEIFSSLIEIFVYDPPASPLILDSFYFQTQNKITESDKQE